ncbi:MAG TPA: rhomboid family intramembrane serine protease [Candidatus Xenobia bacterium]
MDWKRLLQEWGLNPTQVQWRWRAFQERLKRGQERAEQRATEVAYQHKVCQGCGNFLDQSETHCPRCHTKAPSRSAEVARQAASLRNPVTYALLGAILLNALVGVLIFGTDDFLKPTNGSLLSHGAMYPPLVRHGEWWRLITAGYLHIGLAHIAFNSIALWQCGIILEPEIGGIRFFVAYTLSLLGGSLADLWFGNNLSAGASGAIAGIIGLGLSYCHFNGMKAGRDFFFRWVAYNVLFDVFLGGHIDNFAHGGGFVAGLVLGWIVYRDRHGRGTRDGIWRIAAVACLVVTIAAFAGMGRTLMAGRLVEQAQGLLADKQVGTALSLLDRAVTLSPSDSEAWFQRGRAHLMMDAPADAVDDYGRVLSLVPDEPGAYYNRALARESLGQYAAAIDDWHHWQALGADEAGDKATVDQHLADDEKQLKGTK